MMNFRGYTHWMGKPKNGSMPPEEATRKFWQLHKDPNTITDEDDEPPTKELKDRIAVKVNTLLIDREIDSSMKN